MRLLLSLVMLMAMLWSAALVWFVHSMPTQVLPASEKAEALVVLTGGSGRVEHGLLMLAEGAAPVLFISGVGEHVQEKDILAEHADAATRKKIAALHADIVLDRIARSTVANADQSAAFIEQRDIHRIRLITASYHMRRSVHEFHTAIPQLDILPDPVFPEGFRRDIWWTHENTRRLVFSEFYKYIAVVLRDLVRGLV